MKSTRHDRKSEAAQHQSKSLNDHINLPLIVGALPKRRSWEEPL